jgi:hypothetical protein
VQHATIPAHLHDAYQAGRQDQLVHDRAHLADLLAELATAHADLNTAWQRLGTLTRQQRIDADTTAMTDDCQRLNTTPRDTDWSTGQPITAEPGPYRQPGLGRPAGYTYRGGPVNYDTGKPLTTPWQANPRPVAA